MAVEYRDDSKHPKDETTDVGEEAKWEPGFWSQFPWGGLWGFFLVVTGLACATAILIVSDGKRVDDWPTKVYPVTPNVLINLANQVASIGLVTAIGEGIVIIWWRKLMKGSTLREIHYDYMSYGPSVGSTIWKSIKFNKRFSFIAVAALMTKWGVIDSTLFQRATSPILRYSSNYATAEIQAYAASTWPLRDGGIPGRDGDIDSFNLRFAQVVGAWNTKLGNNKVHDTTFLFNGCPPGQSCQCDLDAIGFAFDCKVTYEPVDYGVSRQNGSTLWSVQFSTNFSTPTKPYAHVDLNMAYINSANSPNGSCAGTLTHRYCAIRPAVVRYPQLVQQADPNNAVNVTHLGYFVPPAQGYKFGADLNSSQIDSIQVLNYTDLAEVYGDNSTVGGITFSLKNLFSSNVILNRWDTYWDLVLSGSSAQPYFYVNSTAQMTSQCGFGLNETDNAVDPFITLLRSINSYGYVAALYIDGAPQVSKDARSQGTYASQNMSTSVSGFSQASSLVSECDLC
jgi:hypothetical protein